ncbi:type IV pilin biogenesis protein [Planctomycetes bacterium CA13]|uniref:Type IV pilin biogenesis protein n=1 Tax=Novipirellula herctigrandis TaxID=2527986 RepID=A0A5C5YPA3_9BACT|nr:type IV pilin biogenesis protein [Planctomycetes bacterium CA13]
MNTSLPTASTIENQVARLIVHRETLVPALSALAAEMPPSKSRSELSQLTKHIASGVSTRELLIDPKTVVWLAPIATAIGCGEEPMQLSDAIRHIAEETQLRNERRRAWSYPIFVILVAFLIFMALSVLVVPNFQQMFEEFDLMLPFPTQVLFELSSSITHRPIATGLGIIIAATVAYGTVRLWTHLAISSRMFGSLAVGNSASLRAMAIMTAQLADLLELGTNTDEAFWFAGDQCNHRHYRNIAHKIAGHLQNCPTPISESPWARQLPGNLIYAVTAGDDGKPNVPLLRALSAMYRERLTHRSGWLGGAASYIATFVIAILVFFVVIALYMPLIDLITGLS